MDSYNKNPSENKIAQDAREDLAKKVDQMRALIEKMFSSPWKDSCLQKLLQGITDGPCTVNFSTKENIEGSLYIQLGNNTVRFRLSGGLGKNDVYFNGDKTFASDFKIDGDGEMFRFFRINGEKIQNNNPGMVRTIIKPVRSGIGRLLGQKGEVVQETAFLPDEIPIANYTNSARFMEDALRAAIPIITKALQESEKENKESTNDLQETIISQATS